MQGEVVSAHSRTLKMSMSFSKGRASLLQALSVIQWNALCMEDKMLKFQDWVYIDNFVKHPGICKTALYTKKYLTLIPALDLLDNTPIPRSIQIMKGSPTVLSHVILLSCLVTRGIYWEAVN